MPLADYHFSVKHLKRSKGQSAVASAAYQACEKLHSDYYNEISDYSHKGGLIISEILLPPHVPKEYANRGFLWNEVEKAESRKDAQLAYKFDFALMNEFTIEENIELARRFILENFVSRGMICDWAFHFPEQSRDNANPHIHLMCPIRPMNENGNWGAKQKNVFLYDESGNPILNSKGKQKYKSVKTTDWSDPETLIAWRKAWEEINNQKFKEKGLNISVSADSFAARGLDLIPTIHEGPNVRAMEKNGIITEKGEFNRQVRKINSLITILRNCFRELYEWIQTLKGSPLKSRNIGAMLSDYYSDRNAGAYSNKAKINNLKDFADSIAFVSENNILTVEDLETLLSEKQAAFDISSADRQRIGKAISDLNKMRGRLSAFHAVKAIGETYEKKVFGREKFKAEHETEIKKYYGTKKHIPEKYLNDPEWEKHLDTELKALQNRLEKLNTSLEPVDAELQKLKKLKHCIDTITGNADETDSETQEKEAPERESVLDRLAKAKQAVKDSEKALPPGKEAER